MLGTSSWRSNERREQVAAGTIQRHGDELIELSHFIHAHPELGYVEFESSAALADAAERWGFDVERGSAGLATAFRATMGDGSLNIVYCAEFDALPDVGHACGHNIIAASSLGAAIGLGAVADELDLTVTLLGTPSEEGGGGKIDLIKAGYFDDVHAAMMVHPFPTDRLDALCLAVDHFDVIFEGKEAHAAAAPWVGVNALDAMTIAQVSIGLLRQQLPPGDLVHGIVLEGGSAANIIPSRARGRFMARSLTSERLAELRVRLNACFEAGALATGASRSSSKRSAAPSRTWRPTPTSWRTTASRPKRSGATFTSTTRKHRGPPSQPIWPTCRWWFPRSTRC